MGVAQPPPPAFQQAGQVDFHTLRSGKYAGLKIRLKPVQPMLLNKVMNSVEIPRRPTYETKTVSGRVQNMPMDEQAAAETPGGTTMWTFYQEESERALTEQNNRVVNAILIMGTDCEVPEDGWDTLQVAMGLDVPQQADMRRAHFLLTIITDGSELNDIITKIMRLTGVSEEVIADAEGTFQRSVRNEPQESEPVVNAVANTRETSSW